MTSEYLRVEAAISALGKSTTSRLPRHDAVWRWRCVANLAIDALKVAGTVTIVGEKTAGEMLSQTIIDIVGGIHLSARSWPLAEVRLVA
jgi:hypothetical protein